MGAALHFDGAFFVGTSVGSMSDSAGDARVGAVGLEASSSEYK